jgi:DNA-binding transcriptional ArsR family regulator
LNTEAGEVEDELSVVFAALADPTRRAILARLADGEASVNELAAPFSISVQAVSKHLKVLERAGLISRGRAAQWRPCRLDPQPLRQIAQWTEQYRRHWEQRLDHLDDYIQELTKEHKP